MLNSIVSGIGSLTLSPLPSSSWTSFFFSIIKQDVEGWNSLKFDEIVSVVTWCDKAIVPLDVKPCEVIVGR